MEIQHILNLRCEQWRLLLLLNDIQAGHFDTLADFFLHHAIPCQKLSPIVLRVCEYVDQYYMQEIKLSQIAAQVFVTPNYLSTIFHQEMGMTLTLLVITYPPGISKPQEALFFNRHSPLISYFIEV